LQTDSQTSQPANICGTALAKFAVSKITKLNKTLIYNPVSSLQNLLFSSFLFPFATTKIVIIKKAHEKKKKQRKRTPSIFYPPTPSISGTSFLKRKLKSKRFRVRSGQVVGWL
jgi:hypothetical protein